MKKFTITFTIILALILSTYAFAGDKVAEYMQSYSWFANATKAAGDIGEIVISQEGDDMLLIATRTEGDWNPQVLYPNGQKRLQEGNPDPETVQEYVLKQDGNGPEVQCSINGRGTIVCPIPAGANIIASNLYRRYFDGGFQSYNFLRKCADTNSCKITGATYGENKNGGGYMELNPSAEQFGYDEFHVIKLARERR